MTTLSQAAVRAIMLAAQGLLPKKKKATKKDVYNIIRQMHVLQIDTINVVARSPYLVLWSRLGDYDPRWLEELLAEGALFEYWSHAACFLPIEDYALYRPEMLRRGSEESHSRIWLTEHPTVVDKVMHYVRINGSARSSDFENIGHVAGAWWNWKEEKTALEHLFYVGDLMIAKRHNFNRLYDLRERVLPKWDDVDVPINEFVHEQFVLNTIKALGVTKAEWIADYFRMYKADAMSALKKLEAQGAVEVVNVDGWSSKGYVHPDNLKLAQDIAAGGKMPRSKMTLLSPFDPIVWDRKRLSETFNFDYKLEIYVPEPKRKYGYFTLCILYDNQIIGRLDPKSHRKDGIFEVKAIHFEPNVQIDDELISDLKAMLKECALWHKTPKVVVRWTNVPGLEEQLGDE